MIRARTQSEVGEDGRKETWFGFAHHVALLVILSLNSSVLSSSVFLQGGLHLLPELLRILPPSSVSFGQPLAALLEILHEAVHVLIQVFLLLAVRFFNI